MNARGGRGSSGATERIFALAVAGLAAFALAASARSALSRALRRQEPVFGLIIGTDWVDNARHSDTMVFLRYDPARRTLDLLSVPRDTRNDYPKFRVKRMNAIYTYVYSSTRDSDRASRELVEAVRWLLFAPHAGAQISTAAAAELPSVPYYAQIDYEGFKRMVNLLGGIPVTVDEPMHYDDNWGHLHIHFEPGKYILDGQKALEYVRYRGSNGDFGRVQRQQEFMLSALATFKRPENLLKLPRIAWMSLSAVHTNLGWMERFLMLWELKDLSRERVRLVQLPGKFQHGFWMPDYAGIAATSKLLLSGHGPQPRAAPAAVAPSTAPVAAAIEAEPESPLRASLSVEVWNASGRKGLALDVVRELRKSGFDVVKWGNYKTLQKRTQVHDHRGEARRARALADLLAAPQVEVYTRVETDPIVDLEVILGQDYGK